MGKTKALLGLRRVTKEESKGITIFPQCSQKNSESGYAGAMQRNSFQPCAGSVLHSQKKFWIDLVCFTDVDLAMYRVRVRKYS